MPLPRSFESFCKDALDLRIDDQPCASDGREVLDYFYGVVVLLATSADFENRPAPIQIVKGDLCRDLMPEPIADFVDFSDPW